MDFKSQQEKFDEIKWYDSIVAGEDRCGSYDFCVGCDKKESFPCARAAYRAREQVWTKLATVRVQFGKKR